MQASVGGNLQIESLQNSSDYHSQQSNKGISLSIPIAGTGSASSTTTAAISGVASDKSARTGDAQTGLANTFDAGKVQADINAQVQITQAFGQQASKAVGDYAQAQMQKTQALRAASQEQEALAIEALWGESGSLRLAAHTVIGGLTGGSSGAAGAAVGCRNARRITVKSLLTTSEWIGHQAYKPTLPNPTAAGSGAAMKISMVYCANTSRKSDAWRLLQRMSWL